MSLALLGARPDNDHVECVGVSAADQATIDRYVLILRTKNFQATGESALARELAKVNIYPDTVSPDGTKLYQRIVRGVYSAPPPTSGAPAPARSTRAPVKSAAAYRAAGGGAVAAKHCGADGSPESWAYFLICALILMAILWMVQWAMSPRQGEPAEQPYPPPAPLGLEPSSPSARS